LKETIEKMLGAAVASLSDAVLPAAARPTSIEVERTRDAGHGDFASNVALRAAKSARRNPRELAQALIAALPADPHVARAEVAGPGFINFHLAPAAYHAELGRVLEQGEHYGRSTVGAGERVLVEFVSANPTGPLHVGHGRQAAYGATLASLLAAAGFAVAREYYVNDAGRQMEILAVSVWLRYLEARHDGAPFPANGYRGAYVREIATRLAAAEGDALQRPAAALRAGLPPDEPEGGDKEVHIDALIARMRELLGREAVERVHALARAAMLADIRADLAEFGVEFDCWFSEQSLAVPAGAIDQALARLDAGGHLYRKDGALWFRATAFGDEKDRVVVRENGIKTYFASDIAYHLDKRLRGYAHLIDVLGADHHGYVARVRAGLVALGEPGDCLEVPLIQFVSLLRGGEKVPMGKREAQFVTLRQLRAEVGNDACRFFYLMRGHDQPLDFDLELAKSRSSENPVYYVQYAHARAASVFRQLAERELRFDAQHGRASLALLALPHELRLLSSLSRFPEVVLAAGAARAPHLLVNYLRELATDFHAAYNVGNEDPAARFLVDDPPLRDARLALVAGAQRVVGNGLALLGVSAPDSM
jgi:arginyl-tRNA synthetase